jgi:hypothetical protein
MSGAIVLATRFSPNPPISLKCSFDGGPPEICPQAVGIDRFGTEFHTLVVTAVDEFRQSIDIPLNFRLTILFACKIIITV